MVTMQKLKLDSFKAQRSNQSGFIPMMLCVLGVIAFLIYLVYARVAQMQ
jgi:hypothetical protein